MGVWCGVGGGDEENDTQVKDAHEYIFFLFKIAALEDAGVIVSKSPAQMGTLMKQAMEATYGK